MYYVRKRRKSVKKRVCTVLIVFALLAVSVIRYMNVKLDPIICDIADRQMANELISIISSVCGEIISDKNFAEVSRDSSGKITAAQIDSTAINEFNSLLLSAVSDKINGMKSYDISVSFANIFDDEVIFGSFPSLKMTADVEPFAAVTSEIISSSQSAGINQTLYSAKLVVHAEVNSVLLITNITTAVDYEISLCELILVGDIPNVYFGGSLYEG